MFMKKTGQQLYWNLSESISRENNSSTNLEAIFTTLALLALELGGDDFQVDLVRVCLGLQKLAHDPESTLPTLLRYQIQAMVATLLSLVAQLSGKDQFAMHVRSIIDHRSKDAPSLLPQLVFPRRRRRKTAVEGVGGPTTLAGSDPLGITITFTGADDDDDDDGDQPDAGIDAAAFDRRSFHDDDVDGFDASTRVDDSVDGGGGGDDDEVDNLPTEYAVGDEENLLFSENRISDALGVDVTPLQPLQPLLKSPRSLSDIQSLVSDSSVFSTDRRMSAVLANGQKEDLSFDTLKKIMVGAQSEEAKEAKEKKRLEVLEMFRTAPFEELVAAAEGRSKAKRHQLHDILDKIAVDAAAVDAAASPETTPPPVPPPPAANTMMMMMMMNNDAAAIDAVDGDAAADGTDDGGGGGAAHLLDGQLRLFLPVIMERTAEPNAKLFQIPDYKPPPFFEMKFPDLMIY